MRVTRSAGPGFLLMATALGLAGCATAPGFEPTPSRLVGSAGAFALPPPGGPSLVGVVERGYSNARTQEVALATRGRTPGQNGITIAVLGTGRPRGDDVLLTPAISDAAIRVEMRQALPGVEMRISPFFARNAYGPFGYAFGRGAGGDLCLYGWQRLDSAPRPLARKRAISARMRICEPGASEATLLANMTGYTITVPMDHTFGAGRASGTLGVEMAALGARHVESVLPAPVPTAPPRPRRPSPPAPAVARAEPPAVAVPALPAPTEPPVPAAPLPGIAGPRVPPPPLGALPLAPAPVVPPPALPVPIPAPRMTPAAPMVQAPGAPTFQTLAPYRLPPLAFTGLSTAANLSETPE